MFGVDHLQFVEISLTYKNKGTIMNCKVFTKGGSYEPKDRKPYKY
jgi:hypothetical protein